MRQGPNNRRPRGRHNGGGNGGGGHGGGGHSGGGPRINTSGGGNDRPRSAASLRHQTFDSNCIDVRVRGNAWQVHEKYQALARDAQSSGDRVAAENYLQHAEHYFRIIEAINDATAAEQAARGPGPQQVNFSQQPEVPNNYYGAGATSQPPGAPGAPTSVDQNGNITPMAQAEVQQRNPPVAQAQAPFFASDDAEDAGNREPIAVRR